VVDIIKRDDLMRHGRPKSGDLASVDLDPLAANEISQRASIEKINLDLVVPVGAGHLTRLPDFARKPVRRKVSATAIEVVQNLRTGNGHRLSIVSKSTRIQEELDNSLCDNRDSFSISSLDDL
jgi:hypothetical protein